MQITTNQGEENAPLLPPAAIRRPSATQAFRPLALQNAFSLLELLIVMTLIGLISAVAVPNLGRSLSPLQARSSVNKIAAILRYARSQAVTRQRVCRVLFDVPGRRVEMLADSTGSGAGRETYRLPETISLQSAGPGMGVEENAAFGINFYPGGNSSGGELTLSGKSGRVYRVKVDFITGITEVL